MSSDSDLEKIRRLALQKGEDGAREWREKRGEYVELARRHFPLWLRYIESHLESSNDICALLYYKRPTRIFTKDVWCWGNFMDNPGLNRDTPNISPDDIFGNLNCEHSHHADCLEISVYLQELNKLLGAPFEIKVSDAIGSEDYIYERWFYVKFW
jgi:hypothetical protein